MASKTFLTITKEECLQAYKLVLENSERKWVSAKNLAGNEEHGNAVFMAITSVEELVKSIIILMDGKGFDLRRIDGIGVVFRNHQIRYLLSYAMFVVNVAAQEVKHLVLKAREDPNESNRWISGVLHNDQAIMDRVMKYGLEKFNLIANEFDWFDQLHVFRQDSLYCDYQDYLKNPIQINVDHFSGVMTRLGKVREVGLSMIETLNSEEELYVKHYENLKRTFIEKNFYQSIGNSLKSLKGTRDTPFQVMKNYFQSK